MAKGKERRAAVAKARSRRNNDKPDKRAKKAARNERRGRTGTFIGAKLWERRQEEKRRAREGGKRWVAPPAPITNAERQLEEDLTAPLERINPNLGKQVSEALRRGRGR